MSNEIRKVDPDAVNAAAPKKGLLDWFNWFMTNKDKLWQLVLLVAGLLGGATAMNYRQELTDLATDSLPVSTRFLDLENRVNALEDNACQCQVKNDIVDEPEDVVRVK